MLTLRHHQPALLKAAYKALKSGHRRVLEVAATGFGKGAVETQHVLDARRKGWTVVVLTHREELLTDLHARFQSETGDTIGIIKSGYVSEPDAWIQIASVQTMAVRHWWQTHFFPHPVLWLFEEAHRTTYFDAGKWVLQSLPERHLALGFTATPVGPKGKPPMRDYWDASVSCPLPAQLIREGHLAPFRYLGLPNGSKSGRRMKVDPKQDMARLIRYWKQTASDRPSLFFCSGVEHSRATAEALTKAKFPAAVIHGDIDPRDRIPLYEAFRTGKLRALCCDEILTTGIDWPFLSCIVLAAILESWRELLQMLGRGARPHPSWPDCLVIDAAANIEKHGGIEDVRAIDYSLDPEAGIHKSAVRRQCPGCALILPVFIEACTCGFIWPRPMHPILFAVPARPADTRDRKAYATMARKAMTDAHAPGKVLAAMKAMKGESWQPPEDIALMTVYPSPSQSDVDAYYAYLLDVSSRTQRRGGQPRNNHWLKQNLEAQFGKGIRWE